MEGLSTFLNGLGLTATATEELKNHVVQLQGSRVQDTSKVSATIASVVLKKLFPTYTTRKSDGDYAAKRDVNWSTRARLDASTIFSPNSASEVAKGLRVIEFFNTPFAIRSGGHAPYPDWASSTGGTLISLENLNQVVLEKNKKSVKIGAGCRWGQVYKELDKGNLAVAGGRYADVGCGGLLTGCGTSPLLGLSGFSSDGVLNFEVVTSGGEILNANENENPDLFWALKGGSNNFGIVTHFDLATVQLPEQILSGALIYTPDKIGDVVQALADYQEHDYENNLGSEIGPTIIKIPAQNLHMIAVGVSDYQSVDTKPGFLNRFLDIGPLQNSIRPQKFFESFPDTSEGLIFTKGQRYNFGTLTVRLSKALYLDIVQVFDKVYNDILHITGLALTLAFQAVPVSSVKAGIARGGNPTGLDQIPQLILCLDSGWSSAADDEVVLNADKRFLSEVEEMASARGLLEPYIWMNNAAEHQNVLAHYGNANHQKLVGIAERYDKRRVFQVLCKGGFKLQ
ncbi:hypothetical protein EDB81DRAFT_887696 [Dactylonectria macrodidyma]|uniref:FAD-binding PCMH-type domain-containing protein n=1 Tax=Dactylonectria macrodidyma TaxID=307937 RepID=A0A9P9EC82_9HYPO|nr:hypothetical protein EDB81DRAFT_887696 [Dactylonectria macrodidyma]